MGDAGTQNTVNGHGPAARANGETNSLNVKAGLAKMLKGGVIMDVVNADQVSPPSLPVNWLTHSRPASPRKQAHVLSWPWREYPPI